MRWSKNVHEEKDCP
jgi:hypothetical protein